MRTALFLMLLALPARAEGPPTALDLFTGQPTTTPSAALTTTGRAGVVVAGVVVPVRSLGTRVSGGETWVRVELRYEGRIRRLDVPPASLAAAPVATVAPPHAAAALDLYEAPNANPSALAASIAGVQPRRPLDQLVAEQQLLRLARRLDDPNVTWLREPGVVESMPALAHLPNAPSAQVALVQALGQGRAWLRRHETENPENFSAAHRGLDHVLSLFEGQRSPSLELLEHLAAGMNASTQLHLETYAHLIDHMPWPDSTEEQRRRMQAVVESLHGFLRRSSTVEPQTRAALVLETEYRRLLGSTILALRPNDTTAEEARRVSGVIPLALDHWSLILNFLTNAPLERRIGIARALNVDVLAGLGRNLGLDANDAARLRADLLALLRSSGTVALPEAFGTVARLLRAMHPTADFWAEHAPILATAPPVARREFLHQLSLLPRAGVVLIETLSDLLADPVARPFAVEALTRFETELDAGTRRRLAEARSESSTADGATTSVEAASLAAFLRTCMRDGQAPFSNN